MLNHFVTSCDSAGASSAAGSSLKFWHRGTAAAAPYALNTQADDPHAGAVTCVAISPAGDAAATTGLEGDLRVWVRRGAAGGLRAGGGRPAQHWSCRAVASYRGPALSWPAS